MKRESIMSRTVTDLQPWDCLLKKIVWRQLGSIKNKRILDFGSGIGVTADYLAVSNEVTAVEPDEENVNARWTDHPYTQLIGSTDVLHTFDDRSFDLIICHCWMAMMGHLHNMV